jgi:tetratricopeptide (TPR) repeat protein
MTRTWAKLSEADRNLIATSYKDHFEKSVTSGAKLRLPAKIVLDNWVSKLATKVSATPPSVATPDNLDKSYSPTSSSVFLLTDLGKLFGNLGMKKEKQDALLLLSRMKPSQFGDDQAAKNIWANQLAALAEEYRKSNQYLDAGKLFGVVGEHSENWENRAESLYKSGLLLYRAGRKQEAINSFQKAADDGNNVFYANLAKERLNQIQ